jgi:hypothetical protein
VSRSWLMSLIMTFMFEPAKLPDELGQRQRNQHLAQRRGYGLPATGSVMTATRCGLGTS